MDKSAYGVSALVLVFMLFWKGGGSFGVISEDCGKSLESDVGF